MYLSTLKLTKFRNYDSGLLNFHPAVNAIVGLNGMGKTNILDAIYYLCFGKSYFSAGDRYVVKDDGDFFRISGIFEDEKDVTDVTVKCRAGIKKDIEVLGKKIDKISEHIGRFLCVILAPNDIQLMMDGSEDRRNFLNNTIVQTDKRYLEALIKYTHLLKQRNSLLKIFAETKTFDETLLEAITAGMYDPAAYIHEKRSRQISQMLPFFDQLYSEISGGSEKCSILYKSQLDEGNLKELMTRNAGNDKILARTSQGIHKDDLIFSLNSEPLKNYASQGQLKSFIIALKLTQYKIIEYNSGKKPLILLDDIFDKLDQKRVTQLLTLLMGQNFGQIFITDTNEDRIKIVLEAVKTTYILHKIVSGNIFSDGLQHSNM